MRMRFCGDSVRAITTDRAPTNDGCGKEGWKLMDQAREELAKAEYSFQLAEEYSERKFAAAKVVEQAKKKLADLEFFWLDSAAPPPADMGADMAALNQANAEHYARNGAAAPTEPISTLPRHVTLRALNQRNAGYWGGTEQ